VSGFIAGTNKAAARTRRHVGSVLGLLSICFLAKEPTYRISAEKKLLRELLQCIVEFGRFLHCGFRNPLAAIWAVSQ